jgi:hypothetical protein
MKGRFQLNDKVRAKLLGSKGGVVQAGFWCTVRWKRRYTNARVSISLPGNIKDNPILKPDW